MQFFRFLWALLLSYSIWVVFIFSTIFYFQTQQIEVQLIAAIDIEVNSGSVLYPLLFDAYTPININDYLWYAAFYIQYSRKITFYYIKKELFFFLPLKKVKKVKLCLNWKMMLNLRKHSITSVLPVIRSVSVNPGNNGNVQFTTVSLKALSDQIWIWYPGFSSFKLFNFISLHQFAYTRNIAEISSKLNIFLIQISGINSVIFDKII